MCCGPTADQTLFAAGSSGWRATRYGGGGIRFRLPTSRHCPGPRSRSAATARLCSFFGMEASKSPAYLRDLAKRVEQFQVDLDYFLDLSVHTDRAGRSRLAAVRPPSDHYDKWHDAMLDVSAAAGRVMDVPETTGLRTTARNGQPIDPFAEWSTITRPASLLEPEDIQNACSQALGRIEAMTARAAAEAPLEPETEAMHPLVWGAARGLWHGKYFREAVVTAVGAVIDHVRQLTGRMDLDEKDVFTRAFSNDDPKAGDPRLRWPGDQTEQTARSMNRGLLGFSTGVQAAIRNPSIHERTDMTPQEAAERLAAVSLLMRWIENCIRVDA